MSGPAARACSSRANQSRPPSGQAAGRTKSPSEGMDTAPKPGATGRDMRAKSFMLTQLDNRANSHARRHLPRIMAVAYGGSSRETIPMGAGIQLERRTPPESRRPSSDHLMAPGALDCGRRKPLTRTTWVRERDLARRGPLGLQYTAGSGPSRRTCVRSAALPDTSWEWSASASGLVPYLDPYGSWFWCLMRLFLALRERG